MSVLVHTTLKAAPPTPVAWGSELQWLEINQIIEAAITIHPFHLGSIAIDIIRATNRVWKQYCRDWKGQAWLHSRKGWKMLHPFSQSSFIYIYHAGSMVRGVLEGSWRRQVASVEMRCRHFAIQKGIRATSECFVWIQIF